MMCLNEYVCQTRLRISVFSFLTLLLLFVTGQSTQAQTPGDFQQRLFEDEDGQHKYSVFLPRKYSPAKKWPVILFLHGAGERGTDGRKHLNTGLGSYVQENKSTFPFVVVFPQCSDKKVPILSAWAANSENGERAWKILQEVERNFSIDPERRILTGWSMGGYGVWDWVRNVPDRFAAFVPLSGGGDSEQISGSKQARVWAFHGRKDALVPVSRSREMVEAMKASGGKPRYSEFANAGHDVWKVVYADEDLYKWMRNPVNDGHEFRDLMVRPGATPVTRVDENTPFITDTEISSAVHLRLGNEMLKALSYSIPARVPRNLLRGSIPNISDYTTAEGRSFSVYFTNITYSGKIRRGLVQATSQNNVLLQLGLEDINLLIGTTHVRGKRRSATAGAINVRIGHNRPVWLNIRVEPYVKNRQIRLRWISSGFSISRDNFSVSWPAGVSTRGLGMTRERVSRGLVTGLYNSRGRIENEVISVVPTIIRKLEENLQTQDVTTLVQDFWPLPVYRPRLKVWPEKIVTDENGISLALGLSAAAIDPSRAPEKPYQYQLPMPELTEFSDESKLEVAVGANILEPLSAMLVRSDVARVHVHDIPEGAFARFALREELSKAIPELKRFGSDIEIWSELVLTEPLRVTTPPGSDDTNETASRMRFVIPRAVISLAIRPQEKEDAPWQHFAELEATLTQDVRVDLEDDEGAKRRFRMSWSGEPEIETNVRFAPDFDAESRKTNRKEIDRLFRESWTAWTRTGALAETTVGHVDFGTSRLMLEKIHWNDPAFRLGFEVPSTVIRNRTDKIVAYKIKGPNSIFGGPYKLGPGEEHEFEVPYTMTYRGLTATPRRQYQLAPASEFEFRVGRKSGRPELYNASP